MNHLYYGDDVDALRRYKSNQDYNVTFVERHGTGAAAQFKPFEDT